MIDTGNTPEILKYRGIVLRLAKQYSSGNDFQDLVQAGFLGMYHAISTYSAKKGAKLSTHIFIHARNKIQEEKNSQNLITMSHTTAQKHPVTLCQVECIPQERECGDLYAPDTQMMLKEEALEEVRKQQRLLMLLNRKLGKRDRQIVIDSLIHGISIAKLSKKYRKNVYPILQKAIEIIKQGMDASSSSTVSI